MALFPMTNYDFPNVSNYDGDLRELIQYVRNVLDDYNEIVTTIEELNNKYVTLESDFATVRREFNEIDRKFTTIQTQFAALNNKFNALNSRCDNLQAEITANTGRINALRTEVMDAIQDVYAAIADFGDMVEDFLTYAKQYTDVVALGLRQDFDADIANLQAQIDALQWELPDVYNIVRGTTTDLLTLVYDVYDACRNEAITAGQFDTIGLTAGEFDALEITAIEFDTISKTLLISNKCRNPVTGELDTVCNILADIAQLTTTQNLTAAEFDGAELTAEEFGALNLTAYMYDYYGKQFIN